MDPPLGGARAGHIRRTCRRAVARGADGAGQMDSAAAQSQEAISRIASEPRTRQVATRRRCADAESLERYNSQLEEQVQIAGGRDRVDRTAAGRHRNDQPRSSAADAADGRHARSFVELDVPFLLEERTSRVQNLKNMMVRADITISEKYRLILEAYQIELDYGQTLEAYEGLLGTGADARTVEFVKLGRVSLMYQTLDGSETGYWDAEQKNGSRTTATQKPSRKPCAWSMARRSRFVDRTCSGAAGGAVVIRIRNVLPFAAVVFAAPGLRSAAISRRFARRAAEASRSKSARTKNRSSSRRGRIQRHGGAARRRSCCRALSSSATRLDAASNGWRINTRPTSFASTISTPAPRESHRARTGRGVRLGAPGGERRVDDAAAVVDHHAVPAGEWRALARRVVARVRRRPHYADGRGARACLDRDPTRNDRERPGGELPDHVSCSPAVRRWTPKSCASGRSTRLPTASSCRTCRTLRSLNVLPRQLPSRVHGRLPRRFENAMSGYAQAVVDANRGVLLGLVRRAADAHGAHRARRVDRLHHHRRRPAGVASFHCPANQLGDGAFVREQAAQESGSALERAIRSGACCLRSRATRPIDRRGLRRRGIAHHRGGVAGGAEARAVPGVLAIVRSQPVRCWD